MNRTMFKLTAVAALVCAVLCATVRPALADAITTTVPATLSIMEVRDLSVNTSLLAFGSPSIDDFGAGFTQELSQIATVKSNSGWVLKISGSSDTWTGGAGTKPRSDIQYKNDISGFSDLSGTAVTIYSGNATTSTGVTRTVTYRVKLSFETDAPATYTYNSIVLTLTAP